MVHVPYRGEGPALVDITAGRVDIFIGNISAALRFEKSGQVKFLGLAAKTRSPVAPHVPDGRREPACPACVASARGSAWWRRREHPPLRSRKDQCQDAAAALRLRRRARHASSSRARSRRRQHAGRAAAAFIKDEEARWRAVIKSANVTLE